MPHTILRIHLYPPAPHNIKRIYTYINLHIIITYHHYVALCAGDMNTDPQDIEPPQAHIIYLTHPIASSIWLITTSLAAELSRVAREVERFCRAERSDMIMWQSCDHI